MSNKIDDPTSEPVERNLHVATQICVMHCICWIIKSSFRVFKRYSHVTVRVFRMYVSQDTVLNHINTLLVPFP